jgi:catechol-2,3-dioxygenase
MLNSKGIAWAGFYANNLKQLANFYQEKLRLRLIEHDDSCYIFNAGAGSLFEIWGNGYASSQRKTAHEQSMVIGFLVERLEPVVASLRERGVTPDTEIGSHLGSRWVYYTDPEGNRFEFKDSNG